MGEPLAPRGERFWILNEDKPPLEIEVDHAAWLDWWAKIDQDFLIADTVTHTERGPCIHVTTIFKGVDVDYDDQERPLIYETTIYDHGSSREREVKLSATWLEADRLHKAKVEWFGRDAVKPRWWRRGFLRRTP